MNESNLEHAQFRILGGSTYSGTNRPTFWCAQTPLKKPNNADCGPPALEDLRLTEFLEIEDFEVVLEEMIGTDMGYHVRFYSKTMGFLAGFPWCDHAEQLLATSDFSLPLGSAANPFYDCEQGWEIVIFPYENFVYIMEGDFDGHGDYYAWFKVSEHKYRSGWNNAIQNLKDCYSV